MKTIDIHGKPYVMVKDRLLEFHKLYSNGSIFTELVVMTEKFTFKCTVIPDVKIMDRKFTGHAEEIIGSSQINKTSALENCETSAIGRALGSLGIGIDESFASADEVNTAKMQQSNTKSTPSMEAQVKKIFTNTDNDFQCPNCGSDIDDNREFGEDGAQLKLAKNGTTNQPAFRCSDEDKCKATNNPEYNGKTPFASWKLDEFDAGVDEDKILIEDALSETNDDSLFN